jgi:chemotaxis response regulator CheB
VRTLVGAQAWRTRVIVADDAPLYRELLVMTLMSVPEIDLVASAENGRDAVDLVVTHDVDVALLDVEMPFLDGFGAAAEILRLRPETRVVLHTAMDSALYRRRAETMNLELRDKLELAETIELLRRRLALVAGVPPSAA